MTTMTATDGCDFSDFSAWLTSSHQPSNKKEVLMEESTDLGASAGKMNEGDVRLLTEPYSDVKFIKDRKLRRSQRVSNALEHARLDAEARCVRADIAMADVIATLSKSTPFKRKRETPDEQKLRVAVERGEKSKQLGASASLPGQLLVRRVGVVHGNGIIADRDFLQGDPIIACTGRICVASALAVIEYDERMCYSLDRAGEAYRDLNLDTGAPRQNNMVCYVNSAKNHPTLIQNADICFDDHAPLPVLYALKDIRKGEEILVNYDYESL